MYLQVYSIRYMILIFENKNDLVIDFIGLLNSRLLSIPRSGLSHGDLVDTAG